MEAIDRRAQEEDVVEQPPVATSIPTANGVHGTPEKSVYFEKNEGMWKCHHCNWTYKFGNAPLISHGCTTGKNIIDIDESAIDIPKLVSSVIENNHDLEKLKDKILSGLNGSTSTSTSTLTSASQQKKLTIDLPQNVEEEVIELEFQSTAEKAHTHTPYCPNCSRQITKVILRRRKREDTTPPVPDRNPQREDEPVNLLGCLSCFSLFIPSGDCLNPFRIFGSKGKQPDTQSVQGENILPETSPPAPTEGSGNCLNPFRLFGKRGKLPTTPSGEQGTSVTGELSKPEHSHEVAQLISSATRGDVILDLRGQTVNCEAGVSTSLEILKCIVYGGLMELLASLSVVTSAAASDATTLNILCIGLATMISALFIFGHHLLNLKNDVPQENSDPYQELLGRRGHFLLHSSLAILSFILFGLTPPVVYAFAFRESDNKDYKILSVAVASFICVLILATAKAYLKEGQTLVKDYVKTIMYYVTMAVSVSGVAYAAGHLFKVLMERVGWFEPAATTAGFFVPNMVSDTQAWSSY